MTDPLTAARRRVERMRFSGDPARGGDRNGDLSVWRASLSHNALRISPQVTPDLATHWEAVLQRLEIEPHAASAYVYASAELHADVLLNDSNQCVVRFASALIDKIDAQEFMFWAGHELGHFLLGHVPIAAGIEPSLEDLMEVRASEISADRVGLLACGDLDTSVRAMMKMLSGLGSTHVRFDVRAFLEQLQDGRAENAVSVAQSTHPSLAVRTRALLWLAMTGAHACGASAPLSEEIERIDGRIQVDLVRYIDGPARNAILGASNDLLLWMCAESVARHGKFSKEAQGAIRAHFGDDIVAKLTAFLGGLAQKDASDTVAEKVLAAGRALQHMIPRGFSAEVRRLESQVSAILH